MFVGRYASTHQEVGSAARDAARAAAVRQWPEGAEADARAVVVATLARREVSCVDLGVEVDTSRLAPGGEVTAIVRCTVSTADLSGLGVPGSVTVVAEATRVVDTYRGGAP